MASQNFDDEFPDELEAGFPDDEFPLDGLGKAGSPPGAGLPTYITGPVVLRIINRSSMTLHRWLEDPDCDFPKPFYIRGRRYWKAADVLGYLERLAREAEAASQDDTGPARPSKTSTQPGSDDGLDRDPKYAALALRARARRLMDEAKAVEERLLAEAQKLDGKAA